VVVLQTGKRILDLTMRYVGIRRCDWKLCKVEAGSETTYAQATYFASGVYEKAHESQFSAGTGAQAKGKSRNKGRNN
jgi:hypothetical protein